MINDCVEKADKGKNLAAKCKDDLQGKVEDVKKVTDIANAALQEIVSNVQKVTVLTKEISTASTEQSEGITQVNNAIQQVDTVTQQNAASAEETATASEELTAQAQTLMDQVKTLASQVGGNMDKSTLNTGTKNIARHTESGQLTGESHPASSHNVNDSGNGSKNVKQLIDPEELIPMSESKIA